MAQRNRKFERALEKSRRQELTRMAFGHAMEQRLRAQIQAKRAGEVSRLAGDDVDAGAPDPDRPDSGDR
jgi:hypothetical protein